MKRWLVLALGLVGCHSEPTFAEKIQACLDESVQQNLTAYWVGGMWRLHGSGQRSGCVDPALNSDEVELASPPLEVTQSCYRVWLSDDPPRPRTPAGDYVFELIDGQVGARCVRFRTSELLAPDYDPLHPVQYDFPAEFVGTHSFRGEYTGSGPGTCRSSGEFSVSLDLDDRPSGRWACKPPPPPVRDAGARDSAAPDADATLDADAALDVAPDAPPDVELDVEPDVEVDAEADVETDAQVDGADADAETDAQPDVADADAETDAQQDATGQGGAAPEGEYSYVGWDFQVSSSGKVETKGTGCAFRSGAIGSRSAPSAWLALLALVGLRALRSRRTV